jgi:hypothetical protein
MLFGPVVMASNCPVFGYRIGMRPNFRGGYVIGCPVEGTNMECYKKLQMFATSVDK